LQQRDEALLRSTAPCVLPVPPASDSAGYVRANHNCEHLRKTLEEETKRNRDLARDFEVFPSCIWNTKE
jgi:hypothetical protein